MPEWNWLSFFAGCMAGALFFFVVMVILAVGKMGDN